MKVKSFKIFENSLKSVRIFQVLFFIALLVALISAIPDGPPKHGGYDHHGPVHYNYEYKVHDDYHGTDFGHHESRDGYNTKGEYHVQLPDGRLQTVTYYVDGQYGGYVADVKYSKGVAPKPYHPPAPAKYHPKPPPPKYHQPHHAF